MVIEEEALGGALRAGVVLGGVPEVAEALQPKGQIKSGKTVQYSIKTRKGNTKYIGMTNNPTRRAAEHKKAGKLGRGDKLVVETKAVQRKSAERVEAAKLASHRRRHGSNPKHNTTNDGKFHP